MERRLKRRLRTWEVCLKRWKDHHRRCEQLRWWEPRLNWRRGYWGEPRTKCDCPSPLKYEKDAGGCHCSRRKRGNPKVGVGCCHWRQYRDAVRDRIDGNRNTREWVKRLRTQDPEDVDL